MLQKRHMESEIKHKNSPIDHNNTLQRAINFLSTSKVSIHRTQQSTFIKNQTDTKITVSVISQ